MAASNVIAQVLGGDKQVLDGVTNVGDVRAEMDLTADYQATVNGEAANDSTVLRSNDFVSFTRKVKGGN